MILAPQIALASLSTTQLKALSTNADFDKVKKAFLEAVTFSAKQSETRVKLRGTAKFHIETGYHLLDVNDRYLYLATSNAHSPTSFQSVHFKGGIGLPWGFEIQGGVGQVVSEHRLTALNATVSNQIFDFSTVMYTDIVPSIVASGTVMRSVMGPSAWAFSGQLNLGGYHRNWVAQFAYVFETTYGMLTGISPEATRLFIRHGFVTHAPIIDGWFFRTEIFMPTLSGSILAGYEF